MKKYLIPVVLLVFLISCSSSIDKKNNEASIEKHSSETKEPETLIIEKIDNTKKIEMIFDEFKILYAELLDFKDNPDFKNYGFGMGGPYNKWLKDVETLKNKPDANLLIKKGMVVGELEQLGLEYVDSEGEETELTIFFNKVFSEAISGKHIEKVDTPSGNDNYDKIKKNYQLFGRWEITHTLVNESYVYEIYNNVNEYIGVIPSGKHRTQILEKKGDLYIIKGNKFGEYFEIDSNMNLKLFDSDGELESSGIIAKKI